MITPRLVSFIGAGALGAALATLPLAAQDAASIETPPAVIEPVATNGACRAAFATPSTVDEMEREAHATAQAVAAVHRGDLGAAWELTASGVAVERGAAGLSPARLGRRAAVIASTLRNQNRIAEADAFARHVLAHRWCDLDAIESPVEKAEVLYWSAWLAAEILDDRKLALAWLEKADALDPDSDSVLDLRQRLVDAEVSFPRN